MEQHNQFTEEQSSARNSSSSSAEANDETIPQAPDDPDDGSNNANSTQEASHSTETTDDAVTETLDGAPQLSTGTGRIRTRRTRRNQLEEDEATKAQIRASRAAASTSIWLDNVDQQFVTTEVSTDSQEPPTDTGKIETRTTRRNQTEAEEAMESQMRDTRNANQTTASASLESDSGAHVGDNIDTHAIASRFEADEAMKAQIRASRNADSATTAVSDSLVPSPDLESGVPVSGASATLESDYGPRVGDNIDTHTIASRNEADQAMKAQIRVSRNAASGTTAGSDSLVPSPDLESGVPISSVAAATSANSKTRPEPLTDSERPGVTYVQSRAVGSLPSWSNRNSSPLTHAVANYVPAEMRGLSDVDDQPPVARHESSMVSRNLASNIEEVYKDLPIIAEIAPDEAEIEARVAARLKVEMEERLERQVSERLRRAAERIVVAEAVLEPEEVEVEKEVRLCGLSRNFCYLLLSAGIVVVAVGVVVGVVTEAPTASPAIFSEKMTNMLDLIGPTITSNIELFQDPKTPQYAALQWLADLDEWNMDIDIDSPPIQVWVERYVLALLYHSTNGNSWSTEFNFLQSTSACEWSNLELEEGVICDDIYVTELHLNDVGIEGNIPSELALLSNVTQMHFDDNLFSGSIPIEIFSMTNLKALWFNNNELSGSISTEIAGMLNLHDLHLNYNAISGTLPTELGLLSELEYLVLQQNDLDGTVPSEIGFLTNLLGIELRGNNLRGTIPNEMGQLTNIWGLALQDNSLSGTIPTEIGHMLRLGYLFLEENAIRGSLPTELGLLSNMIWLDLHENELAGSLPSEIGQLTQLNWLYLGLNNMVGSLPSEIGLLTALKQLDFSGNEFTSKVPLEYSNLTALEFIYLQNNDLTGSLNGVFCGGLGIDEVRSDCSGDPPEISCLCCTRCCNAAGDTCVDLEKDASV